METLLVKTLWTSLVPWISKTFLITGLENSMNITPKVAEGADDELVFCERGDAKALSLFTGFGSSPKEISFHGEAEVCSIFTNFESSPLKAL